MKKIIALIAMLALAVLTFAACDAADGAAAADSMPTITISDDGYWVINGEKTEHLAVGKDGKDGEKGDKGDKGDRGDDGTAPTIEVSSDGYLVVNGEKTEYKVVGDRGEDGATPTVEISDDGYWVVNGEKTEHVAVGKDGKTPTVEINKDGYWVINGEVTEYLAADYGELTIEAPASIYSNYPARELKIEFSNKTYATDAITYTVSNANVFVENGKIYATGIFGSATDVTVTAKTKHHETSFTVNVSTFTGDVDAETKVQYYEKNIIKEENKGGIIFIGDSYFDGYTMSNPPFWSDFYTDYSGEKAFLMGISSSQIDDLEVVSERIVYPMEPKEIVIHIGFNDVHHGNLTVDQLATRITALAEKFLETMPNVKVYFIGVEPKKNGYTAGTDYYNSSTKKAPALTEKIKAYAADNSWFTYVDTMSVFVDSSTGAIKTNSYLSTDLSHPTLAAYDEIRTILNSVRNGVNNTTTTDFTINNKGIDDDINGTGRVIKANNGTALTNNYIVSGKLEVLDFNKSNAHIQFRFSQADRFLLWDKDNDGKYGAGYITADESTQQISDETPGATIFDVNTVKTYEWAVVVSNSKAYFFINGAHMLTMQTPVLEYFNIGTLQTNTKFTDIELTVFGDAAYNTKLSQYLALVQ